MPLRYCFTFLSLIFFKIFTYAQEFQWVKEISDQTKSKLNSKITVVEDNNLVLAENFIGTITFGKEKIKSNGKTDFVLVKYDTKGRRDWIVHIGSGSDEEIKGMVCDDKGNIFITGFFNSSLSIGSQKISSQGEQDVFLAKLDYKGNCQWLISYGSKEIDGASCIALDNEGNLIISGTLGNESSPLNSFLFISKYDATGKIIWDKKLSSSDNRIDSKAMVSNHSNDIVLAGSFYNNLIVDNLSLFTETNIIQGTPHLFLITLDKSGHLVWSNLISTHNFDSYISMESALACDKSDNIYIGASYIGSITIGDNPYQSSGIGNQDIFIASCSKNGTWKWVQASKGDDSNYGRDYFISLKYISNGLLLGTGYFDGTLKLGSIQLNENKSLYDSDIFVISIDSTGNVLWGKEAGSPSPDYFKFNDIVSDIAVTSEDEIFLSGRSGGNAKFDKIQLKSSDKNCRYFAKIALNTKTAFRGEKVIPLDTFIVTIYPNPALSEDVTLKMEGTGDKARVIIYDNMGNSVLQQNLGKTKKNETYQFMIKTSELKEGLYHLKLVSGNLASTYKIVVSK